MVERHDPMKAGKIESFFGFSFYVEEKLRIRIDLVRIDPIFV
jgi:hypothetical protein